MFKNVIMKHWGKLYHHKYGEDFRKLIKDLNGMDDLFMKRYEAPKLTQVKADNWNCPLTIEEIGNVF